MVNTDGNIVIGTSVDVGGINTGLAKIQKSFKRIGRLASLALGVKALYRFGKAALDAASDLQEVQNIVDVSFQKTIGTVEELNGKVDGLGYTISKTADGTEVYVEDMSWKIEKFAKTCIENFGISEFAAKQTAGSFMAMGKSMGLSMEEASDMAVSLTGLTGDFSSFYNISQEYARVALSAVYTGETETLKRYGIVLTEANLQEFAHAQGIETSVKKMGARDKAILRYQYIMKATADMQGDFIRTSDTWANSVRVLQQVWKQFLITLGNGLISVLTPLIQALTIIIQKLTAFANTLIKLLSRIFGFKLQTIGASGDKVANSLGTAADNAFDLGDGMEAAGDEAAKAGKKATKALQPFDELNNILTHEDESSNKDSGLGAGLKLDPIDWGDALDGADEPEDIWPDVDSLYDLGKWIGERICEALESIDWAKIYEKARAIGKGLAEFLNGLFSTDLFKDLGHTIAGALNAAIYAALEFAKEFDWAQFGQKIADGISEFFRTFDFASLAQAINYWVQGIWTTIKEFITNMDWGAVFSGIKDFFTNLDPETVALLMGFFALKTLIKGGLLKAVVDGFKEGLGLVPLHDIFYNFGLNVGKAWKAIDWQAFINSHQVLIILQKTLGQISAAWIAGTKLLFTGGKATAAEGALGFMATSVKLLAGIPAIIGGVVLAVKEFVDMWKNGWSLIKTILEAVGIALVAIGAIILGAPALVAGIVAGIVFVVSQLVIVIKEHWEGFSQFFINLWEGIKNFFTDIWTSLGDIFTPVVETIQTAWTNLVEGVKTIWSGIVEWFSTSVIEPIKSVWNGIVTWFSTNIIAPLSAAWDVYASAVSAVFQTVSDIVTGVWDFVVGIITRLSQFIYGIEILIEAGFILLKEFLYSTIVEPIAKFINDKMQVIQNVISTCITVITAAWNVFAKFMYDNVIKPIADKWSGFTDGLKQKIDTAITVVKVILNVFKAFMQQTIIQPISQGWDTFKAHFIETWNNIKSNVTTIWEGIKTKFTAGIAVMKAAVSVFCSNIKDIFVKISEGIKNGIKAAMNSAITSVQNAINKIISSINRFISKFNSLVSKAAAIANKKWSGISMIDEVSFPQLATGAVIPPNNEFLAVLGDQKHGTNVEAPLDTIKQALLEALRDVGGLSIGGNNGETQVKVYLEGDASGLFKVVRKESEAYFNRTGNNALVY